MDKFQKIFYMEELNKICVALAILNDVIWAPVY